MKPRHVPLFALILLFVATTAAQSDRTDDYIRAEMKRQNIPGLSLAVIKDGKVIKTAGYGLADRGRKVSATPETVYKIGSVSKQFIASGIMLLVQEGRLSVDDPVSKYLDDAPAAWKAITIRHLLTHTAGLLREAPGFDPSKVQTDAAVLKTAYSQPLRFAPGEKWEYSNVGYFALAEIIRKVSGRPWTDYLAEKVFTPSGMKTTQPTNTKLAMPNRARGYSDNDALRDAAEWLALRPSGAFLSTVLDLAKWDAVLTTNAVLTETTRRQMWTPVTLTSGSSHPYGFGWHVAPVNGRRAVYHGGGLPGFISHYIRFLDDRLSVVVLMNLDDANVQAIAQGVAALHLPSSATANAR